jgi:hypothetical protein
MRSAAVGRGIALAISFLLVGVAGGEAGHALAGLEGHGLGSAVLATDTLSAVCDAAPPHDATNCLLCRAGRVSSVILSTSVASTPDIARAWSAMFLPEGPAPSMARRRAEAARAPPDPLAV